MRISDWSSDVCSSDLRLFVGDGDLQRVGDGGYDLGARAAQIRDGLFARQRFGERDLLAIQLDDRALFLQRWWQLLRDEAARPQSPRTEERSVGKGCGSRVSSRGAQVNLKKQNN